jgi:hypothetical protein
VPDGAAIRLALMLALHDLRAGRISPAQALEVDRQARDAQARR